MSDCASANDMFSMASLELADTNLSPRWSQPRQGHVVFDLLEFSPRADNRSFG